MILGWKPQHRYFLYYVFDVTKGACITWQPHFKAMHVTMLGRQLHDVAHHVLGSSCTCITLFIWWTVIMSEPNNKISGPPYPIRPLASWDTGPSGRYISVLRYQTWDHYNSITTPPPYKSAPCCSPSRPMRSYMLKKTNHSKCVSEDLWHDCSNESRTSMGLQFLYPPLLLNNVSPTPLQVQEYLCA